MFEVYDKRTLEKVKVYSVGEDSAGYPKFLIRKDNQWIWRSAKWYITEEEYKLTIIHNAEKWSQCHLFKGIAGSVTPVCAFLSGTYCTIKKCQYSS